MSIGSDADLLASCRVTMATPILCVLYYHVAHFRWALDKSRMSKIMVIQSCGALE
jgi:hypothetical protein